MEHENLHKILPFIGEYTEKGNEIVPTFCPFCHGGRHRDKYTFAINKATGAYNCKRGTCGETGNLYNLAKYLSVDMPYQSKETYFREYRKPKKVYQKPEVELHGLSEQNIEYFKTRGISKETLVKNKVTTDKSGNIQFNYYLDGELIFIKYKLPRKPKKGERKAWREKDTRPILYGMDDCDPSLPLIIIEGEPDKLVLDECGVKNCVSIPSGTEDYSWIDECWEWLERFDEIIVWSDNDPAGKGFQQEVIARLDDWKLRVVKTEYKDANELLFKVTKDTNEDNAKRVIRKLIEEATAIKKDHITNLADIKRKDYRQQIAIPTGYQGLDRMLGGMYGGQLVVWTGFNGSGKSTILSNILLNGMENGFRCFVYSGELPKEDFKEWVDLQCSGPQYISRYRCPVKNQDLPKPNEKYYDFLDDYYNEKLYLYDTDDFATDDKIISAMEYMAKREGIKVFALDNLLTMNIQGTGDVNEKQGKLIIRLKSFARTFNAVVHLVAHPRKPAQGQHRVEKYSISGTANISDLADRVMGFHRLNQEELQTEQYMGWNNALIIFKDRKYGIFDREVLFKFDFESKRYFQTKEELIREYSWVAKMNGKGVKSSGDIKPPWER